VIETLAMAALKEQRRARRWSIFFKLLGFAYLTLLVLLVSTGVDTTPHFGQTHRAGRCGGVIDPRRRERRPRHRVAQSAFRTRIPRA